ncbi:hypothetical protein PM082_024081 [Marasmius tenuissimus]|nr:hypothetical protein PM082_024081 [Marasmius tenuissimus]
MSSVLRTTSSATDSTAPITTSTSSTPIPPNFSTSPTPIAPNFSTRPTTTSTQRPPNDTHKANIGVIAGVTSTIGILALVVATFCVIRWKQRRRLNNASIVHPLPPPIPPMTESHTLTSTRPSIFTMTSPRTTAPLDSLDTRSTPPPPRKPPQILPRLERENRNPQSHTETVSTVSDENIPVNKAEFSAMRAEMRAMKTRLAVLEAEAADQPPDYVSSYSTASRSAR